MNIDDKLRRQIARAERALVAAGITNRGQLLTYFDAHSRFTDIRGVGKVLGKALGRALAHLDEAQWSLVFQTITFYPPTGVEDDPLRHGGRPFLGYNEGV